MPSELLLGIDGGGSHTRAWLAHRGATSPDDVIGKGIAGGSNPRIIGTSMAVKNIDAAIDSAFESANQTRQSVSAACLALAGAGRETERAEIQAWANAIGLADRLLITDDALPILYAADPSGVGVALISGTGSLALGRNPAGTIARCGGWGPTFGDEGSGYAIACDALRAAARSADGRGPQTELLPRLLQHFGIAKPPELIPAIYNDQIGRAEIARLSTIVFDIAADGDRVACRILSNAADGLSQAIVAITAELELEANDFLLALTGGVLLNCPGLRELLNDQLRMRSTQPKRTVLVSDPVAGAVVLASIQ